MFHAILMTNFRNVLIYQGFQQLNTFVGWGAMLLDASSAGS
jgi:hypothetical protein